MATAGGTPRRSAWGAVIGAGACVLLSVLGAMAQSPDVVLDIVTSPQRYWNRTVTVRGHVRSVTPDPPGTTRGTYVLRDSSDADLTVATKELPAPGKEFSVTGNIVPVASDSAASATTMPVLREARRRAVGELPAPTTAPPAGEPFRSTPLQAPSAAPVTASADRAGSGLSMNGLVFALIGVVALFSIVMIVAFWPRPQPRSTSRERRDTQGPAMVVLPPRSPKRAPSFAEAEVVPDHGGFDRATQVMPAGGPRALAQPTEVYLDLGATLEVTEGPDVGKVFHLFKPRVGIGRPGARENEVTLNDPTVSREHASIVYSPADKRFRVVNESSTNPVRVNGTPVEEAALDVDDLVQLGASTLVFRRRA